MKKGFLLCSLAIGVGLGVTVCLLIRASLKFVECIDEGQLDL